MLMDPSSLSGLPLNLGETLGSMALRSEYVRVYLESKLGLDPNVTVEAQSE